MAHIDEAWSKYRGTAPSHKLANPGPGHGDNTTADSRYRLAFAAGKEAAGGIGDLEGYPQWRASVKRVEAFEEERMPWLDRLELAFRGGYIAVKPDAAPEPDGREFSDEEMEKVYLTGMGGLEDRIKDLLHEHGYKKGGNGNEPKSEEEMSERDQALLALPGKQQAFELGWEERGKFDIDLKPGKAPDTRYEELASAVKALLAIAHGQIVRRGSSLDFAADKHPVLRDLLTED